MKRCQDCQHYTSRGDIIVRLLYPNLLDHVCRKVVYRSEPDPVTGKVRVAHGDCHSERSNTHGCGPSGKNFQPRRSLLARLLGKR